MISLRKLAPALCLGVALQGTTAMAEEVLFYHDKGFWSEALAKVGDASEAATGVKIAESPYSSAEQYKAFVQSSIASGKAPEMFSWWGGQSLNDLVATGKIAPLDDVWKTAIDSGDFPASTADLFSVDGKPYGLPMHIGKWAVLFNKDIFAEVGVEAPATWADLEMVAEKLKAAGHTPFAATVQDGWRGFIWFQELLLRTNPDAYAKIHTGELAYDSDEIREVFQLWSELFAKGWFTDVRSNREIEDFAAGGAGMYLIGDWAIGLLESNNLPIVKMGAFVMPNVDASIPPAVIVEGSPIVFSTEAGQDEAYIKAAEYWMSADGANVWGAASGNSIGNVNAEAPNEILSSLDASINEMGASAVLRWWELVPAQLQGELVAEFNSFMLDPTMEQAEAVMANIQALNAEYWADQ
ncbi:ABC transporter substrate-binding protein [Falsihalocynthiibacter sp. SS001]|uniref:ABC transporter substrate-binding protein n=1 Tax=Falsihalocynthiibacter sp. SS001 TaxID=3349698 RepID=UPI0036D212A2